MHRKQTAKDKPNDKGCFYCRSIKAAINFLL